MSRLQGIPRRLMGKPRERGAGLVGQHSSDGGRKEEEDTHIKRIIRLAVDCDGGRRTDRWIECNTECMLAPIAVTRSLGQ